jgi:hypothetical protein
MSEGIPIEALYIYTTIVDGQEKVVVGTDGIPFIYITMEALIQNKTPEKMQIWADKIGAKMVLKMFAPIKVIDIIEPMKSGMTQ